MFNDIIVKNFSDPEFAAEIDDATTTLELGNPVCGDRIKVQLKLADGRIEKARYMAWGCATSLATGNVFCAQVEGLPVSKIQAMTAEQIDQMLGILEPAQVHCLEMLRSLFEKLKQSVAA